jgi:hypothetical protein
MKVETTLSATEPVSARDLQPGDIVTYGPSGPIYVVASRHGYKDHVWLVTLASVPMILGVDRISDDPPMYYVVPKGAKITLEAE